MHNIPTCKFEYQIQDCEELDYENKCKKCVDGYSISPDNDRCFVKPTPPQNPKDRIPNCFKFKTENYEECDLCFEGYYLEDENTKCVKHSIKIPECNVYSQTQNNRCIFCSNTNYRSTSFAIDTQCGIRVNYFENCERYSRASDICLGCASDHIFHYDNKRCSIKIDNCKSYNIALRILQCSDCIDSYYLNNDDTLCFNANNSINGCQKYDKGPSCIICHQGFYLDDESKTCFFHDTFLNCKSLSIKKKNICDDCTKQGIRTFKTHDCTPVSTSVLAFDLFCINWNDAQKCVECIGDYVLKNYTYTPEGQTAEITTLKCDLEKGCLQWDVSISDGIGGCVKCGDGYYLYEHSCNKPNTEFCMYSFEKSVLRYNLQYGNNLESGFPCEICDQFRLYSVEQSMPEFRCIQSSFFTNAELVKDCLSFDKAVEGGYTCKKCRRNHFLASNSCTLRPYSATESYYYDKEDRIVTANSTKTVSVAPSSGSENPMDQTWPLNSAGVSLANCGVYGPGLRYCMQLRDVIGASNVVKKNYPFYDFYEFEQYNTDYIIGEKTRYTGALAMDKSDLVLNFTTFKYYLSDENTSGTRKDQEPYIWFDSVPIFKSYSSYVGQDPNEGYNVPAENLDFKRIVQANILNEKRIITVCNKKIYSHANLETRTYTNFTIKLDDSLHNDVTEPIAKVAKIAKDSKAPLVYPCDSNQNILECTSTSKLIYQDVQIIPYLSCFQCKPTFGVRLTLWRYYDYINKTNTAINVVAETDCVKLKNSTDDNDIRMPVVPNCFYFERVLHHINNDIIHYCRECAPGSYPNSTTENPRCPTACSSLTNSNGLETQCDDWYQCSVKCAAAPCDFETTFCDTASEPIGCISKVKECCPDYLTGESTVKDANGNLPANTSDFECGDATRFKCRRKNCLNNCLDAQKAEIGLVCNPNTNRCEPKECDTSGNVGCTCLKGVCAEELCRACLSEKDSSTQYCKNVSGKNTCVDYNLCLPTPPSTSSKVSRILSHKFDPKSPEQANQMNPLDKDFLNQNVTTKEEQAGRVLAGETLTDCPPPCVQQNTCTFSVLHGYAEDQTYFGNAQNLFCNHYTGECTQIISKIYYTCACKKWKEETWYKSVVEGTNTNIYFTKECTEAELDPGNTNSCICLGTSETKYENLDTCPENNAPTWDQVSNLGETCEEKNQEKFGANSFAKNECSWLTYKEEKENKTKHENDLANIVLAKGYITTGNEFKITAGTANDNIIESKEKMVQAITDSATASTATASDTVFEKAKSAASASTDALSSFTTALTDAKATAKLAKDLSDSEPSNDILKDAKVQTEGFVTSIEEMKSNIEAIDTENQANLIVIQIYYYKLNSSLEKKSASDQATIANNKKIEAKEEELKAKIASDEAVATTAAEAVAATAAEQAGIDVTDAQAAVTAAELAAASVETTKTTLKTLSDANSSNTDLSDAFTIVENDALSAQGSVTQAKIDADAAEASKVLAEVYRDILASAIFAATAMTSTATALQQREEANKELENTKIAVTISDSSAASIAAGLASAAATKATDAYNLVATAATSARNLANAADTAFNKDNTNSELLAAKNSINENAVSAENKVDIAKTHSMDASKDAEEAKTAAETISSGRLLEEENTFIESGIDLTEETSSLASQNLWILNDLHVKGLKNFSRRILPPGGGETKPCNLENKCVEQWSEIDSDKYKLKIEVTEYEGGCKFLCTNTVNAKPTPTNDQKTEANGFNDCYNSCSTGDSLERCISGACEKICFKSDPGLSVNCNANEECMVVTGSNPNVCISKPCEDPCDANYEKCDPTTNRCSLQPRKPKILALTSCTLVANCDSKYHLNRCYKCLNYFSFKIPATGNKDGDSNNKIPALTANENPTCIQTGLGNVLMASEYMDNNGITRYTVEKCGPGYTLDFNNNECVSKIKNCKLVSEDGDCVGCDTPYETATVQLVFGVFEKGYCKTWEEFSPTEKEALTPPFQDHCKYYRYKYTSTTSSEVNSLKDGVSTCFICDPEYFFTMQNSCIHRRTENCITYDSTTTTGTCVTCKDGYQLLYAGASDQECKAITNSIKKIPGCSTYDINLNCLACQAGYLFRLTGEGSGQTGYCFEEFIDEACSAHDSVEFASTASIKCKKCTKVKGVFYYPRAFATGINACVYLGQRNLCLNHNFDKTDSLALTNTFVCTLCENEYYLTNGICIRRLNAEIRGCLVYKPTEDTCLTYEASTAASVTNDEFSLELESVQTLLLTPPNYQENEKTVNFGGWILSCEIYKNETTCAQCFAPKYLNPFGFEYNNKCITTSLNIENCVNYSDTETCDKCYEGYMLSNNSCLLITVENCATYENENKCGSCPSTNPYIDDDGNCTVDPETCFV